MGVPADIIYRQRPGSESTVLVESVTWDLWPRHLHKISLPAPRLVSRLVSFVRTLTSGSQFLLMAHWPSNYRHLRAKPSDDCTRLSCSSSLCTRLPFRPCPPSPPRPREESSCDLSGVEALMLRVECKLWWFNHFDSSWARRASSICSLSAFLWRVFKVHVFTVGGRAPRDPGRR